MNAYNTKVSEAEDMEENAQVFQFSKTPKFGANKFIPNTLGGRSASFILLTKKLCE